MKCLIIFGTNLYRDLILLVLGHNEVTNIFLLEWNTLKGVV